jgi:hypothetical protein
VCSAAFEKTDSRPGTLPVHVLTPTMETLDVFTGRLMSFANNPYTTVETLQ